ncbi:MAG TPA: C4-dicarboxylate ABC transporter permease, partial [Gammaproteobacteria bacterium]|nr:C4-dicarboxylate ABC transporter permease [Gammaproteobacteria bacterium]
MEALLLFLGVLLLLAIGVPIAVALGLCSILFLLYHSDSSMASVAQT